MDAYQGDACLCGECAALWHAPCSAAQYRDMADPLMQLPTLDAFRPPSFAAFILSPKALASRCNQRKGFCSASRVTQLRRGRSWRRPWASRPLQSRRPRLAGPLPLVSGRRHGQRDVRGRALAQKVESGVAHGKARVRQTAMRSSSRMSPCHSRRTDRVDAPPPVRAKHPVARAFNVNRDKS